MKLSLMAPRSTPLKGMVHLMGLPQRAFLHTSKPLLFATAKKKVKKGGKEEANAKAAAPPSVHTLNLTPVLEPKGLPMTSFMQPQSDTIESLSGKMMMIPEKVGEMDLPTSWTRLDKTYFEQGNMLLRKEFKSFIDDLCEKTSYHQYLIDGEKGIGKSGFIMSVVSYLITTDDWLVVYIPNCFKLVDGSYCYDPMEENGVANINRFIQKKATMDILKSVIHLNEEKLSKVLLTSNTEIGSTSMVAGHHTLLDLIKLGANDKEVSVPVFDALIAEFEKLKDFKLFTAIDQMNSLVVGTEYFNPEDKRMFPRNMHLLDTINKFVHNCKTMNDSTKVFALSMTRSQQAIMTDAFESIFFLLRVMSKEFGEKDSFYLSDLVEKIKEHQMEQVARELEDDFRVAYNATHNSNDETIDKCDILRDIMLKIPEMEPISKEILEVVLARKLRRVFQLINSEDELPTTSKDLLPAERNVTLYEVPALAKDETVEILNYYQFKGLVYPPQGSARKVYNELKQFLSGGVPRRLFEISCLEGIIY